MTLATIIDDVTAQISIARPSFVVGSSNDDARQLLRIIQLAGDTLMQDHAWGALIRRNTFSATAEFDDFDRFYPVSQLWDVGLNRPVTGPLNQEEWNALLVRNVTGGQKYWTMYQGSIWLYPTPDATDEFTFSYVTKNWIRPEGEADDVARWTADSDVALIPEQLLTLSGVWRWKQMKGLDYAEDLSTFERTRERLIARDRGPRVIGMADPFRGTDWMDTYWPGQIETD